MALVSAGTSASYTFAEGESATITLDQGEEARVGVTSAAGRDKFGGAVTAPRVIGPFSAGDVLSITAMRGDVDYTISSVGGFGLPASLTAAQVAAGGVGANSSDAYGTVIPPSGVPAVLLRNLVTPSYRLGYARNLPREAAPTISVSASAMASPQTFDGCNTATGLPRFEKFAFYGAGKTLFAPRSSAVTQNKLVVASRASADTLGLPPFTTSFYLTSYGGSFDIIYYKDGISDVNLFVDGVYVGRITFSLRRATAQAGAATTMTLDASASATNGFYNQYYLRITGGTGTVGEVRQITGYVGATKIATVNAAWTVNPDATTTFAVDESPIGSIDPNGATLQYINVTFPAASPPQPTTRLIQIAGKQFMGVNIGQNDAITPGPPLIVGPTMIFLGDSFMDGTRTPDPGLHPVYEMGFQLGVQPVGVSSGSTGWWTRGTNNRLSFLNRACPPTEAWEVANPSNQGATGGTWTISVTYNGTTQTTSALAYNAAASAIETALTALRFNGFDPSLNANCPTIGPTTQGCFCVARGDIGAPFIIVANGMVGATISIDSSGLTGGVAGPVTQYLGDIYKNVPRDPNGNALPFLLYMQGSGNDSSATGYTDAKLQTNATTIAQQIVARFPTCIPFFGGLVTVSDGTGGNGIITAGDVAHNAAILAGAAYLPKMHGQVPFIDTYKEGVGGEAYYTGTGSVGVPTNAKRDIMKSLVSSGHPTGQGKSYWTARDTREMHRLLAGFVA